MQDVLGIDCTVIFGMCSDHSALFRVEWHQVFFVENSHHVGSCSQGKLGYYQQTTWYQMRRQSRRSLIYVRNRNGPIQGLEGRLIKHLSLMTSLLQATPSIFGY